MNEIIKDNRHKIDTACQRCFLALDRQKEAVKQFQEERRRIDATPYIQEEKERMTSKAAETLASRSTEEYNVLHECLESMRTAAGEMEQLLDVGTELQSTLAVIKALGKLLPVEQRAALIEPFKGQMRALALLQAAFESVGLDPSHSFEGLIFSTAARVDTLDDLARRVMIQPENNALAVIKFAAGLEKFAAALGVTLTNSFRDLVDTSGALTDAIRVAAGVGTAD